MVIPLFSCRLIHPGFQNNQILSRLREYLKTFIKHLPHRKGTSDYIENAFHHPCCGPPGPRCLMPLSFICDRLDGYAAVTCFVSLNAPTSVPLQNIHAHCCFVSFPVFMWWTSYHLDSASNSL